MYYECSEDKLFSKKILDLVYENWCTVWGGTEHKHFDYFHKNCKCFVRALMEWGSELRPANYFECETEVRCSLKLVDDIDIESMRNRLDACFKTAKSIDVAYLCCLVAKYMALVHGERIDGDSVELSADYSGDLYMEDLFLDALLYVYLYRIDTDKNT